MRETTRILMLSAAILGAGCGDRPGSQDGIRDTRDSESGGGNRFSERLRLHSGFMQGHIGRMRELDQSVTGLYGSRSARGASVSLLITRDDGAAMAIVDLNGDLNHPDFQPGSAHTYQRELNASSPEANVSVVGCAGREAGTWDFDESADDVQMTVGRGSTPDARTFDFTARWMNQAGEVQHVAHGSFEMELPLNHMDEVFNELGVGRRGEGALALQAGQLAGDVGSVTGLAGETTGMVGGDGGTISVVQLLTENDQHAAMAVVTVMGGLHHAGLKPGASAGFDRSAFNDDQGLHVFVAAFSGDDRYHWNTRQVADHVQLTVVQGEDSGWRQYNLVANLPNGQNVSMSFRAVLTP